MDTPIGVTRIIDHGDEQITVLTEAVTTLWETLADHSRATVEGARTVH
jgi:hypothetical protein